MTPQPGPIIVAHRGLHERHPENSLAAMTAVWQAGILWCECDVQVSADGIPVVIHDDTLDRTTTGRGPVIDYPACELVHMCLRDSTGRPTEQTIPRLDEFWANLSAGCHLLVETKPLLQEAVLALGRQILAKSSMLQSFHIEDIQRAGGVLSPKLACAVLAEKAQGLPPGLPRVHLNYQNIDAASVRMLRQAGTGIGAWTVNDRDEMQRLAELGIDMIITDVPLEAKNALRFRPITR